MNAQEKRDLFLFDERCDLSIIDEHGNETKIETNADLNSSEHADASIFDSKIFDAPTDLDDLGQPVSSGEPERASSVLRITVDPEVDAVVQVDNLLNRYNIDTGWLKQRGGNGDEVEILSGHTGVTVGRLVRESSHVFEMYNDDSAGPGLGVVDLIEQIETTNEPLSPEQKELYGYVFDHMDIYDEKAHMLKNDRHRLFIAGEHERKDGDMLLAIGYLNDLPIGDSGAIAAFGGGGPEARGDLEQRRRAALYKESPMLVSTKAPNGQTTHYDVYSTESYAEILSRSNHPSLDGEERASMGSGHAFTASVIRFDDMLGEKFGVVDPETVEPSRTHYFDQSAHIRGTKARREDIHDLEAEITGEIDDSFAEIEDDGPEL